MKKLILAAMVLGLTYAADAQTDNSKTETHHQKHQKKNLNPDERSKQEADRAAKDLSLTPEQKAKWQTASLERIKANKPLKEKMKGSTTPEERGDIRRKMRENTVLFETSATDMLTLEQKAKFNEFKKNRQEKYVRTTKEAPAKD